MKRLPPETLACAVILVVTATLVGAVPCADVSWQLWVGEHLRQGARLYVDIIESNPPLWFWMAIPIDWVAAHVGATSSATSVAAMGLLSILALIAAGRLLRDTNAAVRTAFLAYGGLTLMLIPLREMEQREHILLVCTFPYFILAAARRRERAVSRSLAIAIGLCSSLGFGLKHYFLIAPILIELWLMASLTRRYRPFRPEAIALGLMAFLYAAAVLMIAPAYLRDIVPMLRLSYGALQVHHLSALIGWSQYYWALAIVILTFRPRILMRAPMAMAFTIAAVGFGAAWLIQFKGWANHMDPVTACLMVAIAALLVERWQELGTPTKLLAPTLLIAPLWVSLLIGVYRDPADPFRRSSLHGLTRQDSIAFVSEKAQYAWPLTLQRGSRYPSRFYAMEFVHALVADHGRTPAITALSQRYVYQTAADYSCVQPNRIVFDNAKHDEQDFDLEAYFLSDPAFARLMGHYRRLSRDGHLDIFQRIAPFPAPPAAACRRGV